MSETLTNFYNVKYFNAEKYEMNRFQTILDKYYKQFIENQKSLAWLNSSQRVVFSLGLTSNLIFGTHKVYQGLMTAGDIVLMQSLMMQIFGPLFMLGVMYRELQDSTIDIKRLYNILDESPKIQDSPDSKDYVYEGGKIEFRNVNFGYSEDKMILSNVNFTIGQNSWVSFVGDSGIGKSTICNMIFRLYDPREGEILLDGQNLKDLKMDSYRKYMGIVSQTPYLFNDSIFNNFRYSQSDPEKIKLEKIVELCKQFQLHDKIMGLPQQYDTNVGEQGGKFSGGEKQRISLIRALLRDPQILILDEPTSSLDSDNEQRVMDYLRNLRQTKNVTIFMITHRLNLNQNVDQVIYLGKKGYLEVGTHQKLLKDPQSRYYRLWEDYSK